MADRSQRQYTTYTDAALGDRIEDAADEHGMSVAELLREGAKRELSHLQAAEELER